MQKTKPKQDSQVMLLSLGAIAVIPLAVWWTNRPLSAPSATELATLTRENMAEKVAWAILAVDEVDTKDTQIAARWQTVEEEMSGGSQDETAAQVLASAQKALGPRVWPVTTQRGFVGGQEVRIVVAGWPRPSGQMIWVCGPSAKDLANERRRKQIANTQVCVVAAQAPFQVLSCTQNQ